MNETEVYRLLASADRQLVLHELITTGGKATEGQLARRVAARRHGTPPEAVGENEIERAHVRLVHVHFPFMRDLDVIEWDDGEVELTEDERIDQLLEAAEELEDWPPEDLGSAVA